MADNRTPLDDADYKAAATLIGCDVATIKAVAAVESSSGAFGPDGRCIIRFEVHKFWEFWGKANSAAFALHFKFFQPKPWLHHRASLPGEVGFTSVHAGQDREWKVFTFACSLNETAAMKSISMGMFQLMGFNYTYTAHDSVQSFFADHCESASIQLACFARFCLGYRHLAAYLKVRKWFAFAGEYNGTGKAKDYADKLASNYHL